MIGLLFKLLGAPPAFADATQGTVFGIFYYVFWSTIACAIVFRDLMVGCFNSWTAIGEAFNLTPLQFFWVNALIFGAFVSALYIFRIIYKLVVWFLTCLISGWMKILYWLGAVTRFIDWSRIQYVKWFGFKVLQPFSPSDLADSQGRLVDIQKLLQARLIQRIPNTQLSPVETEGAYSTGFMYETDGIPRGVFLLYGRRDPESPIEWLGQGFACENKGYVSWHQIYDPRTKEKVFPELFIGTPRFDRVLPVKEGRNARDFNGVDYDTDVVEIEPGGAFATLGIKNLKPGVYDPSQYMTYFHYDPISKQYYSQSAEEAHTASTDADGLKKHPLAVFTYTKTTRGDSGMPVLQKDKVVLIHQGDAVNFKCNSAHPLIPFFLDIYKKKTKEIKDREIQIIVGENKYETAIIGESNASKDKNRYAEMAEEYARQQEKEDEREKYAEKYAEHQERVEEQKQKRMLGQHADEQGFRDKRTRGQDRPELNQDENEGDGDDGYESPNEDEQDIEYATADQIMSQVVKGDWSKVEYEADKKSKLQTFLDGIKETDQVLSKMQTCIEPETVWGSTTAATGKSTISYHGDIEDLVDSHRGYLEAEATKEAIMVGMESYLAGMRQVIIDQNAELAKKIEEDKIAFRKDMMDELRKETEALKALGSAWGTKSKPSNSTIAFESPSSLAVPQLVEKPKPMVVKTILKSKSKPQSKTPKKKTEDARSTASTNSSKEMKGSTKSTQSLKEQQGSKQLTEMTDEELIASAKSLTEVIKSREQQKSIQKSKNSSEEKELTKSAKRRLQQRAKLEKKLLKDLQGSTPPQKEERLSETALSSISSVQ